MGLDSFALQLLNGLSHATTLFLMASGLTLIFGVTRIVNFAHGSFFMLGALVSAHALTRWWPVLADSAGGYAGAMLLGAAVAALLGALAEFALLRRMRQAPELYQLVATFGLTLALHDAMRWFFGPDEVFAPRFPGLKGAVALGEAYFPTWQLFTLVLGPLVWWGLHALLTRTLWGKQVKAATQDRDMLDALGVKPAPLMLGVVMLGCALAGLAGALQLPREPANLQMDVSVVVETFVVVVTGGLGSVGGAFAAAVLIGVIHALGVAWVPQATLVLVFLTMAVVLVLRPQGSSMRMADPKSAGALHQCETALPDRGPRLCQACVEEDLGFWGFSYWRRNHQVRGVDCCPKHGVLLHQVDSSEGLALFPEECRGNAIQLMPAVAEPWRSRFTEMVTALMDLKNAIPSNQALYRVLKRCELLQPRHHPNCKRAPLAQAVHRILHGSGLEQVFPTLVQSQRELHLACHSSHTTHWTRSGTGYAYALALTALYAFPDEALRDALKPLNSEEADEVQRILPERAEQGVFRIN